MATPIKRILQIIPPLLIVVLWGFIVSRNYIPNTILTGWDDLHPEYNLFLNIKRSLWAAWQEYQGLGLLGGMGHAADLPRQLILLLVSPIIPVFLMRYSWAFAMLLLGPLGVYFFSLFLLKKHTTFSFGSILGGLVAALFYLFNLATVQYFYTPYEAFMSFYGFLPWLVFLAYKYLETGKRRDLFIFLVISFLGSPAFYVQTLFVVYSFILGIGIIEYLFLEKSKGLKRVVKLLGTLFAAHAYWLLPVLIFSITNVSVVDNAKINSIATPDTVYLNRGFGSLKDIALLRGYWFEYTDEQAGEYGYLMPEWREHVNQPFVEALGISLFLLSIIGLFFGLVRKKKWSVTFLVSFFLSIFMLTGGRGFLAPLFEFLTDNIPLFGQVFRSSFTKWSVAAGFIYSIGICFCIATFAHVSRKVSVISFLLISLLSGGIIFTSLNVVRPLISGNLISSNMRQEVPSTYFSLFEYFDKEPKQSRILFLPMPGFWGWNFYDWGYRGSGFLWYGIEQPIVDRAFDVWSDKNESMYHELQTTLLQNDSALLEKVLDKYDVTYVLVDESVTLPEVGKESLRIKDIHNLLSEMGIQKSWQQDFISVYKRDGDRSFISSPEAYVSGLAVDTYIRKDPLYKNHGDYVSRKQTQISFPFSFVTEERLRNIKFRQSITGETYASITSQRIQEGGEKLVIPPFTQSNKWVASARVKYAENLVSVHFINPIEIELNGKKVNFQQLLPPLFESVPRSYGKIYVSLGGKTVSLADGEEELLNGISIDINKPLSLTLYDATNPKVVDLSDSFIKAPVSTCWEREGYVGSVISGIGKDSISFKTKDAVGCQSLKIGQFPGESLVTVSLPFISQAGGRPHFCVVVEGEFECKHDDIFYHSETSKTWSLVSRQIVFDNNIPYWIVISARPPDEAEKEWDITYKSPQITVHPRIASVDFSPNTWKTLKEGQEIQLPSNIGSITTILSTVGERIDFSKRGRIDAYNCDIFERGTVDKKDNPLTYIAQERGTSCDFVQSQESKSDNEYILRFVGENKSGRGMKFYLYNQVLKNNEMEVLIPSRKFDESYSVLSWSQSDPKEHILNIETRSLGGELSENSLESATFYTAPLSWLSEWSVTKGEIEKQSNKVKVISIDKYGTGIYQAKVEAADSGILTLSQSFNGGWVAYSGLRILPHYKYNTWANAWDVPQGKHTITIIYIPQLVQWLGFVLLIGGLIYFVIGPLKKRRLH